jgi:site-specific DNA-cytosine methylase
MELKKIILDLCGGTGSWSKFYNKDDNYDVRIIDYHEWGVELAPGLYAPYVNYSGDGKNGDIRLFKKIKEPVYGILAAPPCTHFAGSGARWWKDKGLEPLRDGLSIVDAVFRIVFAHKPKFWVLENPVGRLVHYIGKPKMIFNPCDYGDPYTKKTCLWGEFNEPIKTPVEPKFITVGGKRMSEIHYKTFSMKPNDRARERSKTPQGFAKAFYEANK